MPSFLDRLVELSSQAVRPQRPRPRVIDVRAEQARVDAAPLGSVGAPGGVLGVPDLGTGGDPLLSLLSRLALVPGVGDIAGPLADARMFATQPESRTAANAAVAAAGLLPGIPSLGVLRSIGFQASYRNIKTGEVLGGAPMHLFHVPELKVRGWKGSDIEDGFIDGNGKFFTREEALRVAETEIPGIRDQLRETAKGFHEVLDPAIATGDKLTSEGLFDALERIKRRGSGR